MMVCREDKAHEDYASNPISCMTRFVYLLPSLLHLEKVLNNKKFGMCFDKLEK